VHTARAGNSRTPQSFSPRIAADGCASQSGGRHLLYGMGIKSGWLVGGPGLLFASHWVRHRTFRGGRHRDQNARVTVLRKLPLKKTDVDVPEVTDWTLLDLADTLETASWTSFLLAMLTRTIGSKSSAFAWLCQDDFCRPWLLFVGTCREKQFQMAIFCTGRPSSSARRTRCSR